MKNSRRREDYEPYCGGLSPPEAVQGPLRCCVRGLVSVYIIAAYSWREHAMKTDDPRLEAGLKELFERIKRWTS